MAARLEREATGFSMPHSSRLPPTVQIQAAALLSCPTGESLTLLAMANCRGAAAFTNIPRGSSQSVVNCPVLATRGALYPTNISVSQPTASNSVPRGVPLDGGREGVGER